MAKFKTKLVTKCEYEKMANEHLDKLDNAMIGVIANNMHPSINSTFGDNIVPDVAYAMRVLSQEIDDLRRFVHLVFVVGRNTINLQQYAKKAYRKVNRLELEVMTAAAANINAAMLGKVDNENYTILRDKLGKLSTRFQKMRKFIDRTRVL